MANPGAAEVSHAFFAQGIAGAMQWLAATHPPLAKRIVRIDPSWDGKYDSSEPEDVAREEERGDEAEGLTRHGTAREVAAGAAVMTVMAAIDQIGVPNQPAIDYAHSLLSELPVVIKEAAREPHGARAIVYSLVLDKGQAIRDRQLRRLEVHADPDVYALTLGFMAQMDELDVKHRLPLVDIAVPALKQLSQSQYESFRANLIALIEMDSRIDLLEWSLQRILFNHLDRQFFKPAQVKLRRFDLADLVKEVELVLSLMAHAGGRDQRSVEEAFGAAVAALGSGRFRLLADDQIRISDLDSALARLEQLKPQAQSLLLKACAASIWSDQGASAVEVEVFRAFAGALDYPLPPTIA